ncbi:MAG TPA: HAD domain-containing protein [Ignavibacteriaceae bacterium]
MSKFILFLDFDGVMHPQWNGLPHLSPLIEKFCKLPLLENILEGYDPDIVISSSWKTAYPLDILQCFLGDHLGSKVIGVTPDFSAPYHPTYPWMREAEVRAWLSENQRTDPWVAIDDWKFGFSQGLENLYITTSDTGLIENDIFLLRKKIQSILIKNI